MKNNREYTIKELCEMEFTEKKLAVPIGYVGKKKLKFIDFKDTSGLFIAGTTGTGKSILIDDIVVALMHKNKPSEVRFIMLDPKKMELVEYNGIKYLIGKSESKSRKGINYLISLLKLLEARVHTLVKTGHRTISGYNCDEKEKWPHVFVIVDEGCDIIKMQGAIEAFSRILEYGEFVGIHLIYATNAYLKGHEDFIELFKYRISFDLASVEQAELIDIKDSSWQKGEGNAIVKESNGKTHKIHTPHVSDDEINEVVSKNM